MAFPSTTPHPAQHDGPPPDPQHRSDRRRTRASGSWAVLLAAGLVASLAGPATAAVGASAAPGRGAPSTYSNPLEPRIPGDGVVESCADPTVLRGQDPDDDRWYMYCTTDPLNDEDLDDEGDLVFHRIPQLSSTDLVHWTYEGDAFAPGDAGLPSWADPRAALWAPEVVHSTATDQYYLFVGVTNTSDATSGEPGCTSDNAIGVAVGETPLGPWTFSQTPVVAPRRGGAGCNFLWTYDPDVLGDSVGSTSVLYYGSYYGGIFGTPITLTEDGATAGTTADDTQVTLDNKYEGANVVERDGWYYLFVSATNCCNGALTGYSVFVGRSRSPLGPFVDREGNSLVDPQVGGTPFLTMNGNRWVGTGHNTVFQDAAGDWWTIYHAVDQSDPFFATAPGFTKRPALLDAVDWVDGWPVVNGGAGPSDTRMDAPAAQLGDRPRRDIRPAPEQTLQATVFVDDFSRGLSSGWSWVREPTADQWEVRDGVLRMDILRRELYQDENNAPVLLRDAPNRAYAVETRVRVDVPDEGCCFNYAQAGLIVYGGDDEFVKLTNSSIWNTRQTEWAKEIPAGREGWSRYGNTVVGPPSEEWTWLRIVVEPLRGKARRDAGGDTAAYTAYTSQDGRTWVRGGTWTHSFRDPQIGLVAMGQQPATAGEFTAEFDYVRVYNLRPTPNR